MRTLVALVALVLAVPALAADEPGTFGMAQRGSLKIVSGVLLSDRGGEMKGVWLDAKKGCFAKRTLRVSIQIDLVSAAGKTTRIRRARAARSRTAPRAGRTSVTTSTRERLGMGVRERPLEARSLRDDHEDDRRDERPDRPGEPLPAGHAPLLIAYGR